MKILIVEDVTQVQELLMVTLSITEAAMFFTRSGSEALELAAIVPFDKILLDVRLQNDPDGLEVCRQLKANPKTAHLPVAIVSAVVDQEAALAAGADAYFAKPFSPAALLNWIDERFDR